MVDCCKVIVTFIGRRPVRLPGLHEPKDGNHYQAHGDVADVLEMLEEVYRLECELDSGISMDTVLVCNGGWPLEANKFIERINGSRTARGVLRVIDRANTGLSFGGYSHVFEQLRSNYKFWIFTEDDVLYVKPNYAVDSLRLMRKKRCHFITPLWIGNKNRCPHCAGGVGFSRRGALDKVAQQFAGKLPYFAQKPRSLGGGDFKHMPFAMRGEIALTNTMARLGMRLEELPGLVKFYYDWKRSGR